MPVFVHLTPARNLRAIRRQGIAASRARFGGRGVYAMPVTRNFSITHQWVRELRHYAGGTVYGVYFRLPDDEPVRVGHFNFGHRDVSAAQAVALVMEAETRDPVRARREDQAAREAAAYGDDVFPTSPEGLEVVVPRSIRPAEILRVRALPQVVGWRHFPGANGQRPRACICCERGRWGIRRMERRVERDEARGREPGVILFGREDESFRRVERMSRALEEEKERKRRKREGG